MPFDIREFEHFALTSFLPSGDWNAVITECGLLVWMDAQAQRFFGCHANLPLPRKLSELDASIGQLFRLEQEPIASKTLLAKRDGESQFGWIDERDSGHPIDWQIRLFPWKSANSQSFLYIRGQDVSKLTLLRNQIRRERVEKDNELLRDYLWRRQLGHEIRNCLAALVGATQILGLELSDQTELLANFERNLGKLQQITDRLPVPMPSVAKLPTNLTPGYWLENDIRFDAASHRRAPFVVTFQDSEARRLAQQDEFSLERQVWLLYENGNSQPECAWHLRVGMTERKWLSWQLQMDICDARAAENFLQGQCFLSLESFSNQLHGKWENTLKSNGRLGFEFPLSKRAAMPGPFELGEPHFRRLEVQPRAIAGRGTVLIVDDQRDVRIMLQKLLTRFDLDSKFAEDGETAMELCRWGDTLAEIKLVFLDLQLPGMSGTETARGLRQLGCSSMIVGLTGSLEPGELQSLLDAGFDSVFEKPLSILDLERLLTHSQLISSRSDQSA